ncbi:hypothetical protein GCM10010279_15610 [Streptomyces mutabilis]|nr:hypothetical protein GCM10010279_15610 [Streptomyces mutabilis]
MTCGVVGAVPRAVGRPVSVRSAALRGEAGKSGDSRGAAAARANGFSVPRRSAPSAP